MRRPPRCPLPPRLHVRCDVRPRRRGVARGRGAGGARSARGRRLRGRGHARTAGGGWACELSAPPRPHSSSHSPRPGALPRACERLLVRLGRPHGWLHCGLPRPRSGLAACHCAYMRLLLMLSRRCCPGPLARPLCCLCLCRTGCTCSTTTRARPATRHSAARSRPARRAAAGRRGRPSQRRVGRWEGWRGCMGR